MIRPVVTFRRPAPCSTRISLLRRPATCRTPGIAASRFTVCSGADTISMLKSASLSLS